MRCDCRFKSLSPLIGNAFKAFFVLVLKIRIETMWHTFRGFKIQFQIFPFAKITSVKTCSWVIVGRPKFALIRTKCQVVVRYRQSIERLPARVDNLDHMHWLMILNSLTQDYTVGCVWFESFSHCYSHPTTTEEFIKRGNLRADYYSDAVDLHLLYFPYQIHSWLLAFVVARMR